MKRFITLLIAAMMLAMVLPMGSQAEETNSQMTPSGIAYGVHHGYLGDDEYLIRPFGALTGA